MANKEGIIFEGYLLSEEDFIQQFCEKDNNYFNTFQQEISQLANDIQTKNLTPGEIYQRWDAIQKEYFTGTTILEIFCEGEDNVYFSPLIVESEVVSNKGIESKRIYNSLQDINKIKQAKDFQQKITKHYQNLLKIVENQSLTKKEAKQAHILFSYSLQKLKNSVYSLTKKNKQKIGYSEHRLKEGFTGKTFREVIYQTLSGQQFEGKVWDAFMNHMGDFHKEIFAALSQPELIFQLMNLYQLHQGLEKSVYVEENNHFVQLLYDSLNSTPWFASGDIVIVGSDGKILYNIQLKTTTNNSGYFKIATVALTKLITAIESLGQNRLEIAKLMYEKLKTSASNQMQRGDNEIQQKLYQFVEENIKK